MNESLIWKTKWQNYEWSPWKDFQKPQRFLVRKLEYNKIFLFRFFLRHFVFFLYFLFTFMQIFCMFLESGWRYTGINQFYLLVDDFNQLFIAKIM